MSALLSEKAMENLLGYARIVVGAAVFGERIPDAQAECKIMENRGAFVTLHTIDGALRGCLGMTIGTQPVWKTIRDMAEATPTRDTRFSPVTEEELPFLVVEISVLTPLSPIKPDEVEVGRHGLLIRHRGRSGLLLPQVATEWEWDRMTFLAQTCKKAGLREDAWREADARLFGFEAQIAREGHDPAFPN
jgi:AmmeMemoRadiSam system protein A